MTANLTGHTPLKQHLLGSWSHSKASTPSPSLPVSLRSFHRYGSLCHQRVRAPCLGGPAGPPQWLLWTLVLLRVQLHAEAEAVHCKLVHKPQEQPASMQVSPTASTRQDRGRWDRQSAGKAAGSDFSEATLCRETLDTRAPNSECNEPRAFQVLSSIHTRPLGLTTTPRRKHCYPT